MLNAIPGCIWTLHCKHQASHDLSQLPMFALATDRESAFEFLSWDKMTFLRRRQSGWVGRRVTAQNGAEYVICRISAGVFINDFQGTCLNHVAVDCPGLLGVCGARLDCPPQKRQSRPRETRTTGQLTEGGGGAEDRATDRLLGEYPLEKPDGCDARAIREPLATGISGQPSMTPVARGLVAAAGFPLAAVNKQTALSGPDALPSSPPSSMT